MKEKPITRFVRLWRDVGWIWWALSPHLKIQLSITTDWRPKFRLWRWSRKAPCEVCGKIFRSIEEGCISRSEQLCGAHCMMTVAEIEESKRGK